MDNQTLTKNSLFNLYESYRSTFNSLLNSVEASLKKNIKLASMPTFKSRVKSFDSYYRKVIRLKPDSLQKNKLPVLTDMIGIRVICAFLEDLGVVEKQICEHYNVKEIERKGAEKTYREFGYESTHILIEIPEEIKEKHFRKEIPENLVCEIQIRTILQDAWAEVEHELVYKSEFSPFDLPLRRKLASMNASLSLADIIFQEIRDYQDKLNRELDFRRNSFYEKADELSQDLVSEKKKDFIKPVTDIAPCSPYVQGTIDDMILEAIHAHNSGDLDRAIQIYTLIIQSKPEPNAIVLSVIYKHRGMASFAKNQFKDALKDFEKSCSYDSKNFRSFYYVGIVYSVLNENEKALKAYDKSLKINDYQAHVYYRKALSHYNLSEYSESLSALDRANQLGLDDNDCKALHEKLMKKLDMSMN